MKLIGGLDEMAHRRALKRWDRIAEHVETLDLMSLKAIERQACDLRARLDGVVDAARDRMTDAAVSTQDLPVPRRSDWAWRPAAWSGRIVAAGAVGVLPDTAFGPEMKVFHDCPRADNSVRQLAAAGAAADAKHAISIDTLAFEGTFLSLVHDLPEDALDGLGRRHIVQVDLTLDAETAVRAFVRLNIVHGPNTETVETDITAPGDSQTEFDLAYLDLNEERIGAAWLDLIFERPVATRIVVGDMILSRRLRADL